MAGGAEGGWGFGAEVGDGAGLTTPPPPPGEALKEELGQLVLLVLRDGKKVTGWFRSFDQFANIVLESAFERIIVGGQYCDVPLGVYLVRGENLVMMCRTDLEAGLELPGFRRVSEKEIKEAERAEQAASLIKGTMLKRFDFLDLDL